MAAGIAVDADESMGEYATLEVRPDLALDESGDGRPLRSRSGEEADELCTDDFVEERRLGLVADVVFDGWASTGTSSAGHGADRSRGCLAMKRLAARGTIVHIG